MSFAFSNLVVNTAEDLEHAVAQIPEHELAGATGIVLRISFNLWGVLADELADIALADQELKSRIAKIVNRAPNVDVFVLLDGHNIAMQGKNLRRLPIPYQLINKAGNLDYRPVPKSSAAEIRKTEFAAVFEKGRARSVICSSANFHFALPSGAHASQFIRLSDTFTEIAMVDRIAYWIAVEIESEILPDQKEFHYEAKKDDEKKNIPASDTTKPHALIVDHPSMLILASRVHTLISLPIEIVAFPAYPTDIKALQASFEILSQLKARCASAFVVIGVASTGRLANHIQQWGENDGNGFALNVRVLYAVQQLDDGLSAKVMCQLTLPSYQHYAKAANCTLCPTSKAVPVHTSNYLIGHTPSEPAVLKKKYFDAQRDFFDRWGRYEGVLRVHFNDPNQPGTAHHAFYIDVDTLLDIPDFRSEILEAIKRLPVQPNVIVVPALRVPRKLGRIIAKEFQLPLVELNMSRLTNSSETINSDLLGAENILLADDVFSTGSRLNDINKYFREQGGQRAPNLKQIQYWTVLATPASPAKYARAKSGLTSIKGKWSSTLDCLYSIVMPDWTRHADCPWCQEHRDLTALIQSDGGLFAAGPIVDRIAALQDTNLGITKDPFFSAATIPIPNLGAGSFAQSTDASPIRALFSCASGIQQLRNDGAPALNADDFPAPSYFALHNFSEYYSERLLWLAMLRSLKGGELEEDLKQYLMDTALDKDPAKYTCSRSEIAVAWLTGKLGAIKISKDCQAFFDEFGISWNALYSKGLVDRDPT